MMPACDRQLGFEEGLPGFILPSRANILAVLASVLPPATIAQIRAGLEQLDSARKDEIK